MKIDPATNLPELPEGHFWRIKLCTNSFSSMPLEIQLRKKLWIFSTEVSGMFCTESDIAEWAGHLAYRYYVDNKPAYAPPAGLLGDYPPKRFEL